jgi:hypothetical protein
MKEEKKERRSIPVSSIQLNSHLACCLEIHTNIAKYRASIAYYFFRRQAEVPASQDTISSKFHTTWSVWDGLIFLRPVNLSK